MCTKEHEHTHHNHHIQAVSSLNRAFIIGISLNLLFVVIEFIAGYYSNSMGLVSDAGHNLSDVTSLALALLAFRLAGVKPNAQYTYGYRKSTILVSLFNAVLLLTAVIFIVIESIDKLLYPKPVVGSNIIIVAAIGVVINAFTAFLFIKGKDKDINVKGAYFHMMADALVSVGVVVSGIIIMYTNWYFIDAAIGLVIAVIITYSTWSLLQDSIRLSLDGVPTGIDISLVLDKMKQNLDIKDIHHVHIWAISTTETAITAHVMLKDISKMEEVKLFLKNICREQGIYHATFEFESDGKECTEKGGYC